MKTRVITAVALLPFLIAILLATPAFCTAILFGLMAAIGAYELLIGTGILKTPRICIYCAACAFWCVLWCGLSIGYAWLLLGILVFWCLLFAEMMASEMRLPFEKMAVCLVAGVILPLLLGSVVRIRSGAEGSTFVLLPFVIAFMSDTGAYFSGINFGKHKLAPTISPKKTIEGVAGGVAGAIVGVIVYCIILHFAFAMDVNYLYALIYGAVGSAAGVFGDLCFSAIKRQVGIKDYGNLIPGHGGILDRFDSMMLVGPVTEILLMLLPLAVRL